MKIEVGEVAISGMDIIEKLYCKSSMKSQFVYKGMAPSTQKW